MSLRWDAKWGGPDAESDKSISIGVMVLNGLQVCLTAQVVARKHVTKNSMQDIVPLPLQLEADGNPLISLPGHNPTPVSIPPPGDAGAAICAALDELATSDPSMGKLFIVIFLFGCS